MKEVFTMRVTHYPNEKLFKAEDNGKEMGRISYSESEKMIIIDSTQVDPLYKGQKIGDQLVEAVVKFARDTQKKIVPLCPFAKAYFEKRPGQYTDVLDK